MPAKPGASPRRRVLPLLAALALPAVLTASGVRATPVTLTPASVTVGSPPAEAPQQNPPEREPPDRDRPESEAPDREPSPTSNRKPLTRSLDRYLDDVSGELAVSVLDLPTGLSYSYNRGLRAAAASIVKVDIVIALLLKAQRQGRGLTAWERRTAAQAIKVSDNAAASALWAAIGGSSGLAAANKELGLRHTRPGPGGAWGSTTTSAADQVRLLKALSSTTSPLSAKHRRYVLGLMRNVVPHQAWGVSAAGRGEADVALKNGWLPRQRDGGRWTVNSIGRVRDRGHTFLIAVISRRNSSMGVGIKAIERVSRLFSQALARASARR
ncbi:serine hydrolase [Nonomuraea sp. KM88]|uniref:serine hydrolase n=1 Tax=Nonomuraea sp. KM88 TaxID=3457427 RepID=UPI003FCE5272